MSNPFAQYLEELKVGDKTLKFWNFNKLDADKVKGLPYSIRVVLEATMRNCDGLSVREQDVQTVLNWKETATKSEIPFQPARVVMQDFTGVPAVVDLAAMRDAMKRLGGNPTQINPFIPVDLVVDHSVQVDAARVPNAVEVNQAKEFERNHERFEFLKWGSTAFDNLTIVPPGNGIVHQVNLEYLARVVFNNADGVCYPDTVVGTDSHTTMINGLGVLGWGVGGIEAEAAMLGAPSSMVLPTVVGYKLTGTLATGATATDLVLTIVANLRKHGVVGKFVEFYGPGLASLSIADRATISNMAPEYGATCGYFPIDNSTLQYLRQTGREDDKIATVEAYARASGLFDEGKETGITYLENLELDLGSIVPCISGPKRPHDYIAVSKLKEDFGSCCATKAGFKGFGLPEDKLNATTKLNFQGSEYELSNGSVVIAAITSCTNTSNPSVLMGAGLLAKKALEKGLNVKPYIKTSLSPGSGVVTKYLSQSGLQDALAELGFTTAGYGCMTCIGNSGELFEGVQEAFEQSGLVACAVLSGNRNFEARVHPLTQGNYLASPPLVVAYALAGTMNINLDTEPIGTGKDGPVMLKDIWPSAAEIQEVVNKFVTPESFREVYANVKQGNKRWDDLVVPEDKSVYAWNEKSTYIHNPPFFQSMAATVSPPAKIQDAYVLLNLGDSVTTDHISPAGSIARTSPAAKFLTENGVDRTAFNTYGARRGNDLVMARGTFANTRISNKLCGEGNTGPVTVHIPSGEQMPIFDAAQKYITSNTPTIVLAGKEYGSGSSRDWAAKGPYLLGVKAVIAESFERIHRSNLVGMGIVPMCYKDGDTAEKLGLKGNETFTIELPEDMQPGQDINVTASTGTKFTVKLRFDTPVEIIYYRNGGILQYVLRNKLNE